MALRRVALSALPLYGLEGARIELAHHGYNTTFRLQHARGAFALRINVGSSRTPAQIAGEVAWIEALSQETDICLPAPVRSLENELVARVQERSVVVYHWIEGRHFGKTLGLDSAKKIGELLAKLHAHGASYSFPNGTERPVLLDVVDSLPWRAPETPLWTDTRDEAQAVVEKLMRQQRQITHFDVHLGNVKIHRGEVSVFDFDDSLMAWPGMDVAQSMFYLRRAKRSVEVETALFRGLGRTLDDYGLSRREFEALVAGRALLLACDLLGNQNAELQKIAPMYIANTEARLVEFQRSGRFDTSLEA